MRASLIILATVFAPIASSAPLFYGGDWDKRDALLSQHGGEHPNFLIFDDFNVEFGTTITALYADMIDSGVRDGLPFATKAYYEIRTGVSKGNFGTVLTSAPSMA